MNRGRPTQIALGIALLLVLALVFLPRGERPELGVVAGKLRDCPSKPNCVCTEASDDSHRMDAIPVGDTPDVMARLRRIIEAQPRTTIVSATSDYLRVEFTTALMRFVDDVEFRHDAAAKVLHFRSASRIGHSDLGTNRRRMETLKDALLQDLGSGKSAPASR